VEEVEVFKVSVEYIQFLVRALPPLSPRLALTPPQSQDLYNEVPPAAGPSPLLLGGGGYRQVSPRRMLYAPVLSLARSVLVSRMPRPEEVRTAYGSDGV
jgi:hypothetical protein